MVDISISEEALAAFDSFKPVIALINYQVEMLLTLLRQIANAWASTEGPVLDQYCTYISNEGQQGYQKMVIPPRFVLSPFFSRMG